MLVDVLLRGGLPRSSITPHVYCRRQYLRARSISRLGNYDSPISAVSSAHHGHLKPTDSQVGPICSKQALQRHE
jgi:hypothetical protein